MGYAISWLAVKTDTPEGLFSRLGLTATGEDDEFFETPVSGGVLKNGWCLVVANDCTHRIVGEELLMDLSKEHDLVACSVEEHVMVSTASHWRSGQVVWTITHDSSRGMTHLEVSGSPPPKLQDHRSRSLAELAEAGGEESEVDYLFDVPLEVAKDLTGFKHDEDSDSFERTLQALQDETPRPKWKFW